jgi:hypothetical protein
VQWASYKLDKVETYTKDTQQIDPLKTGRTCRQKLQQVGHEHEKETEEKKAF